jgi:AraC family transcriptional activator of pobA
VRRSRLHGELASPAVRRTEGFPVIVERLGQSGTSVLHDRPPGHFVLAYLSRARGRYLVDGLLVSVADAQVILLDPHQTADLSALEASAGFAVAFRPDALNPRSASERRVVPFPGDPRWASVIWTAARLKRLVVPETERALWLNRSRLLAWELQARALGYEQAARAQLTAILIGVSRLAFPPEIAPPDEVDPSVLEAIEAIEEHYAGPLSLEDVARMVGRSPRHLSRLVRQLTGETVMHWIDERRMEEARRLLLETDATIETVARHVGYGDTSYFRRRFRRRHGVPPATWRAERTRGPCAEAS